MGRVELEHLPAEQLERLMQRVAILRAVRDRDPTGLLALLEDDPDWWLMLEWAFNLDSTMVAAHGAGPWGASIVAQQARLGTAMRKAN